MQNQIIGLELTPLVLQKIKNKNNNNKIVVSIAAAIERMCFTSPGCGRSVVVLSACGKFFIKLAGVGSSIFVSIPEFPCSVAKAFCLFTTACGKSRAGEM